MSYIVITVWESLIRTIYLYQPPAVFLMLQWLKQLEQKSYYTGSQEIGEGIETENIFHSHSKLSSMEEDEIQMETEQERDFEIIANFILNIVD